jgi:hypothetical protein
MTENRTLRFLRTTRGQLVVLGSVYAAAAVLALVAVVFFSGWFESTVYERFKATPSERLRTLAGDVAAGRENSNAVKDLSATELLQIYSVCIDESAADPQQRLSVALWEFHGDRLLPCLRRTLVVGNSKQRLKALEILGTMPAHRDRKSARQLCEFALRKSRRRGETDLSDRASTLLRQFDDLR